ncbi:MAG: glucose-6-phosphate isomerase [Proteobacteria bacterium]|nr:glucose-6-phosphate isomerase [Pseudomonadota bacterium]
MTHTLFSQRFKNISPNKKIQALCKKSADLLRKKIKASELAAIEIISSNRDLKEFENFAKKISDYKKILILGVGGSSLGGKTLSALKSQEKVEFIESIDPATLQNCLSKLDFKNTFFLVISKSGETIETICQTLILLDELQRQKIKNFAKQFLFVTESEKNSLAKIAKKIGAEITPHSDKIGGRYSCFSIVGLLPAMLVGLDAKKIRGGAKKVLQDFLSGEEISNSCAIQLTAFEQGFNSNVVMPYIDQLKNFTDWYRQLWAESLGKNGFGSTPINSMGTVDQHSQLQLYLDGPKDKFFTFITAKKHRQDFEIKDLVGCETLFGGKKLSEIVGVEQETTIEVLNQKNLPIRIFETVKFDEEVLGGLMMQMFLETILIAYVKGINPFDQPAVELRKNLAKKLLKN